MGGSDELFGRILLHGPSQGTVFLLLSRMKEDARVNEVIQGCLKALQVFPDDPRLRKLLAESFLEVGFVSQAENEMEKVASFIRELAVIYKRKAELTFRQGRHGEALEALNTYLGFYPEDSEAQHLLQRLRSPSPPPPEPEKTRDLEPPAYSPEMATPTLAEICLTQGHVDEAVRVYEEYLGKHPADETASRRLAEIRGGARGMPAESPPVAPDHAMRARTERIIAVLENWLAGIRRWNGAH